MKINNKEVLQSYILTTAKYDYSVYEKRILYRIIELNQKLMEGKRLNSNYAVNPTLHRSVEYIMPYSAFLTDEDKDKNHKRIKDAFLTLSQKIIEYENDAVYKCAGIIFNVKLEKRQDTISFYVADWIYNALMDFSKGYRKYELATAMSFQSEYSMRFYELFSNQAKPINYGIDTLKEMFKISDKYIGRPSDFIKRVVDPAKKELDKLSPYTFVYKELKTGRKITSLQFIPIYQASKEDVNLKSKKIGQKISTAFYLNSTDKDYLQAQYGFTDKEIKNNSDLFEKLYKELEQGELIDKLSELRRKAGESNNPKGYVISSLRQFLEDRKMVKTAQIERNIQQQKEQRSNKSQNVKDILKGVIKR